MAFPSRARLTNRLDFFPLLKKVLLCTLAFAAFPFLGGVDLLEVSVDHLKGGGLTEGNGRWRGDMYRRRVRCLCISLLCRRVGRVERGRSRG